MKRFVRDCVDQTIRALFWAFVISLVIAQCFLGSNDALSVAGFVVKQVSLYLLAASVLLVSIRRLLRR